jgi:hypothetical protein
MGLLKVPLPVDPMDIPGWASIPKAMAATRAVKNVLIFSSVDVLRCISNKDT